MEYCYENTFYIAVMFLLQILSVMKRKMLMILICTKSRFVLSEFEEFEISLKNKAAKVLVTGQSNVGNNINHVSAIDGLIKL